MKKIVIMFLFIFIFDVVYASDRDILTDIKCIDGDTIKATINDSEETIRFIGIDTPETKYSTKTEDEPYAVTASEYTCNKVMNANIVEIEYDPNSDNTDKYGRILGWIFVDDILLQKELVYNGYARVKYIYNDYKYLDELKEAEVSAMNNKSGIWSDYEEEKSLGEKILDFISNIVKKIIDFIEKLVKDIFSKIFD